MSYIIRGGSQSLTIIGRRHQKPTMGDDFRGRLYYREICQNASGIDY